MSSEAEDITKRKQHKAVLHKDFPIAMSSYEMVPLEGLEPPRPCEQQILSLPRLPFRHRGCGATIAMQHGGSTRAGAFARSLAKDARRRCSGLRLARDLR